MTNHHPRCEHVDASLIDVWRVSYDGTICLFDDAPLPEVLLELEGAVVDKIKMPREVFEHTPEFNGW